jgi:hypothetical protein
MSRKPTLLLKVLDSTLLHPSQWVGTKRNPCENKSYSLKRGLFFGSQVFDRNWNAFENSFDNDVPFYYSLESADDQPRLSNFE